MNAEVHEEIPKLDESNHSVTVNKTIKVQDEQVPTKLLLNILFYIYKIMLPIHS